MAGQTYRTSQGDMWDSIAFALWGEERLMHHLLSANPEHAHTVVFGAGVVLTVPDVDLTPPAANLPPWKR